MHYFYTFTFRKGMINWKIPISLFLVNKPLEFALTMGNMYVKSAKAWRNTYALLMSLLKAHSIIKTLKAPRVEGFIRTNILLRFCRKQRGILLDGRSLWFHGICYLVGKHWGQPIGFIYFLASIARNMGIKFNWQLYHF